MASKYLQKYPVPEDFQEILSDFTKEVLRAQPDDILQFAYEYFEAKMQGTQHNYDSKYNIKKKDNPKTFQKNQLANQARNIVEENNAKQQSKRPESGPSNPNDTSKVSRQSEVSHPEEKKITRDYVGGLYNSAINQLESENQEEGEGEGEGDPEARQDREEEKFEFQYEGPIEEYESAALKIQKNFRKKKR